MQNPLSWAKKTISRLTQSVVDYGVAWFETLFMRWVMSTKRPFQNISFGFLVYMAIGLALLALPISRTTDIGFTDLFFTVTSAVSTTGLATVSTGDAFTGFGQVVILLLFQLGGLGFMTLRSFIAFSQRQRLAPDDERNWSAGFSLPQGMPVGRFIQHIVFFTVAIEIIGAVLLYFEFKSIGVANAAWSAIFHSVSAFATAGFSLYNDSFEGFRDNTLINVTLGLLCYFGSIGFIVLQDFFMALRYRSHRITLTSKVILTMTAAIFIVQFPLIFLFEPAFQAMSLWDRALVTGFQIMAASSTSGFNSVSIGALTSPTLTLIIIAMVIGASPSGTGGGIRTTTVSSLFAVLSGVLRGHQVTTLFGERLPMTRVISAIGTVTMYMCTLSVGIYLLTLTENQVFLKIVFEAASALSTVGMSMGITGELSEGGKWVVITLMYIGRVGPVTLGLALLHNGRAPSIKCDSDLAT
jgi:trk system potassium uptake protein